MTRAGSRAVVAATLVALAGSAAGLQAVRDEWAPVDVAGPAMYVRSTQFVKRAVLSYDSLAADVYWMRALQHYGRTRLSQGGPKEYELLYPLLDLTTSLDPRFTIAYRFGAIFLAEPSPGGAGRTDLAVALLEKGLAAQPSRWEFAQDIGFVHYWWRHDYATAADWFERAAAVPGAPNWMGGLVAVTRAKGGDRETSRHLWAEILAGSEQDWLRVQAQFRLKQLDAMDQIDQLERLIEQYRRQTGALPRTWASLGVRAPKDPDGFEYRVDPFTGTVTLDPASTINPLPGGTSADRP
jgi:hypothetical protein